MAMYYAYPAELYHHGIKGMKWGVRRFQNKDGSLTGAGRKRYGSDGIGDAIRRKQRSNATADLNEVRSKLREVDSELRELRGYEKNPSKLGKSKISTAIRRNQIKSLEKTRSELKGRERDDLDALKELDSIDKYRAEKKAKKAAANEARIDKFKSQNKTKKAADRALDAVEDYLFFNGDKIPNEFAIRSGIQAFRSKIEQNGDFMDASISALEDYNFFKR